MQTITPVTKDFIRHCQFEKNLSEKTLKAYATDLAQFSSFLQVNNLYTNIQSISKFELRQYLESLAALKPKSIKRKMATLKAMFNYLDFDEQIAINPVRKMRIKIKEPVAMPKVMEITEIHKILKAAYQSRNKISDKNCFSYFEALRNIVIIELLFSTGGRVSEISNLKHEDINFRTGEIMINGKGKKQRTIQVCNEELLHVLRCYKKSKESKPGSEHSFFVNRLGKKISDQSIRLLVSKLCKKAGIARHITPHIFRHSFATLLLEKDVDIKYIQAMLGHSSISTTQIYTHVNKIKQRHLLKTRHPRKDLSFKEYEEPE